jgi:hypothetical protein
VGRVPELSDLVAMMPFAGRLGIELAAAAPEEVTGRLAWREDLCTGAGRALVHTTQSQAVIAGADVGAPVSAS